MVPDEKRKRTMEIAVKSLGHRLQGVALCSDKTSYCPGAWASSIKVRPRREKETLKAKKLRYDFKVEQTKFVA
jgi:hypothetical protein